MSWLAAESFRGLNWTAPRAPRPVAAAVAAFFCSPPVQCCPNGSTFDAIASTVLNVIGLESISKVCLLAWCRRRGFSIRFRRPPPSRCAFCRRAHEAGFCAPRGRRNCVLPFRVFGLENRTVYPCKQQRTELGLRLQQKRRRRKGEGTDRAQSKLAEFLSLHSTAHTKLNKTASA